MLKKLDPYLRDETVQFVFLGMPLIILLGVFGILPGEKVIGPGIVFSIILLNTACSRISKEIKAKTDVVQPEK